MFEKKASTQFPINELIQNRWSGRAYNPSQGLSQQQIVTLLEAARWAPSCFGDEPWRLLVCNRDTDEPVWNKVLECLTDNNRSWAKNAPILILICANSVFDNNNKPNRWGQYDTGAAAMNLCLQATAMGLMAHQMGGFDLDKIRTAFAIPDTFIPMAVMTVGYQLSIESIPDELRERELAQRKRKPLQVCFFNAEWGNPVE